MCSARRALTLGPPTKGNMMLIIYLIGLLITAMLLCFGVGHEFKKEDYNKYSIFVGIVMILFWFIILPVVIGYTIRDRQIK